MNKKEFLDTLESCLDRLPSEEKKDALNYYRELFDEAGSENEQDIIENLGKPEDIARQLLIENGISPDYEPEFMPEKPVNNSSTDYGSANNPNSNNTTDSGYTGNINNNSNSTKYTNNRTAIIVIILVLTSPVWLGLLGGAFGVIVGIFAAVIGILIALCAVSIALVAAGITTIFLFPPAGVIILGTGFIITGISMLIIKPAVRGIYRLIVMLVNKLVSALRNLSGKRSTQ